MEILMMGVLGNFGLGGIESWVIDQAQALFIIGFVIFLAVAIFKRSIGGIITILLVGTIIAAFIFFPDTIEQLGGFLNDQLSTGEGEGE